MGVVKEVGQFSIHLVALDPTQGSEIRKTRPAVVVSPNEMNRFLRTVIIAPMTSRTHGYPTRIPIRFRGKDGEIALDQIRTVDKGRLIKRMGSLPDHAIQQISAVLVEMFSLK